MAITARRPIVCWEGYISETCRAKDRTLKFDYAFFFVFINPQKTLSWFGSVILFYANNLPYEASRFVGLWQLMVWCETF